MNVATSIEKRLFGLDDRLLRSKGTGRVRSTRRRDHHGFRVAAEVCRLEDRCMLSTGHNQFPPTQVKNAVPVSSILWNGGPAMPGAPSTASFPSPSAAGAMKTITLTNNGPSMVYPFIRGANTGQDPNATSTNKYYDRSDVVGRRIPRIHRISNTWRHVYRPAEGRLHHIPGPSRLVGWRQLLHRDRPELPDFE